MRSPRKRGDAKARAQVEKLLQQEIHFVGNRSFPSHNTQSIGGRDVLERRLQNQKTASVDNELPAHLARMCISDLLTSEEEQALFRRMNYLKYRANSLRSSLDPQYPCRANVQQVSQLLSEAERIRDHLVHSNIRLVISIVRKHVTRQFTFDELLSEGLTALVQAAEKFDYDRGFRFSTYAFRVVSRSLFRFMQTRKRDSSRFYTSAEETVLDRAGESSSSLEDSAKTGMRKRLHTMLKRLDRRERFILRCRYALGGHRKAHTLQFIALKLGISKERVRQIEKRAIGKLTRMAAGSLDDDVLLLDWLG